jgi:hypothetical protein
VLDDNYIYLELEGVPYEATYQRVMVPIPVHIWEVIRRYPGVDLSFAEKTDAEIQAYVEREVDTRIEQYHQAENPQVKHLLALCGAIPYGTADTPREEQIARGIAHFQALREHQRQIKKAIAELEQRNKA